MERSDLLDGVLEALTGAEAGGLGGRDLDGLTGARITAHASLPLLGLERAEARNLHARTLLEGLGDHALVGRKQSIHGTRGVSLRHASAVGKRVHEFGLVHLAAPVTGNKEMS